MLVFESLGGIFVKILKMVTLELNTTYCSIKCRTPVKAARLGPVMLYTSSFISRLSRNDFLFSTDILNTLLCALIRSIFS